jgi:hypothetical protein
MQGLRIGAEQVQRHIGVGGCLVTTELIQAGDRTLELKPSALDKLLSDGFLHKVLSLHLSVESMCGPQTLQIIVI